MKLFTLISLIFLATGALQANPPVPAPPPPNGLKNILIWVAGKDPAHITLLENDMLELLADHDVAGMAVSKLFPQGMPASAEDALSTMRTSGCDSVLVLHRRPTINWDTPTTDKAMSSLKSFLLHKSKVLNPSNQAEADAFAPI